jgi:quinol-cytochrome oxidoreductase complex cytochrome b subunit
MTTMSTPEKPAAESGYRFFPDHVMTEVNVGLFLFFLCCILAIVLPPELGEKANPLVTPEHIKPEWYFFPMYKWIKMTPEAIGLYVPMLVIAIFIGWPFVDKAIIKATGSKTLPVVIGLAGMVFVTLLMIFEALP